MRIAIVTMSDDNACIDRVSRSLEARGARAIRLDTDRYPTSLTLSTHHGADGDHHRAGTGEERADLAEVDAVWYRRIALGRDIPATLDPQLRAPSVEESRRSFLGVLGTLPCFVMDRYELVRRADNKLLQLQLARAVGLETPRTLVSNDPEAVREFASACGGAIVTKMMSSFAVYEGDAETVVFTNPVAPADLDELDGLRLCPMTFQERLAKEVELRVTVVGERVFAASIDSQALERSRTDWRREGLALVGAWRAYELPDGVRRSLLALMDRLGLNYGAIDFVVTPDGRHVFLEINPVGEFFWLEDAPGFPLSEAIADVLTGRAPRRENALADLCQPVSGERV